MSDPKAAEGVRDLQAARTGADDDDRIRARREGPGRLGHVAGRFAARSRRACAWSMRYITLGWLTRNGSTWDPGITRQRIWRVAMTSAIAGTPRRIATSPKKSPRWRRANSRPSARTSASPSTMTKKPEPD